MRTLEEILNTPVGLLTDEEIGQLDPDGQAYARKVKARIAREAACPGHEAVSTGTFEESRRGWHPAKCKHCGKDMSIDSGD
jgi:hypothetical protein